MFSFLWGTVFNYNGAGKNAKIPISSASDLASGPVNQETFGLCRHCQQIPLLFTYPDKPQILPHHSSYKHLRRSAETCHLCLLFSEDKLLRNATEPLYLNRTIKNLEFPRIFLSRGIETWSQSFARIGGDKMYYLILAETGM